MSESDFKEIMFEINKKYRQELRTIGFRKNVVVKKYILPKEYITKLLKDPVFRRAWERKILWVYRNEDEQSKGTWNKIQASPNIGGVPVEEGPELKVLLEIIPRRKRSRKNK